MEEVDNLRKAVEEVVEFGKEAIKQGLASTESNVRKIRGDISRIHSRWSPLNEEIIKRGIWWVIH